VALLSKLKLSKPVLLITLINVTCSGNCLLVITASSLFTSIFCKRRCCKLFPVKSEHVDYIYFQQTNKSNTSGFLYTCRYTKRWKSYQNIFVFKTVYSFTSFSGEILYHTFVTMICVWNICKDNKKVFATSTLFE